MPLHWERYFAFFFRTIALQACMMNCRRKGSDFFPTACSPFTWHWTGSTSTAGGRFGPRFRLLSRVSVLFPAWWAQVWELQLSPVLGSGNLVCVCTSALYFFAERLLSSSSGGFLSSYLHVIKGLMWHRAK